MRLSRTQRRHGRDGCRPRLEDLETRTLLTGGDPTDSIIQASATRAAYHVDGSGLAAAMIDTGVDYSHQAFGPDVAANYGPGHTVEDGYDFSTDTSNPHSANIHGTATAGLVASVTPDHPGVAPGANIVSLKVIGNDGSGSFTRIVEALQFAIDHRVQDHISVVNISLSDGGNYPYDFFSNDNGVGQELTTLIDELAQDDIPVVTAAGNSFDGQTQGMGLPAILPDTISVTATDPNDVLLPDAQRLGAGKVNSSTTLAAPGQDLIAPTHDDEFTPVTGTSFAAPLVTGGIILLQQVYEQRFGTLPTVADVKSWLQGGAKQVYDPTTGITIGRLDIEASAALIPQKPTAPQTQVYVNGQLHATIPSSSVDDPLAGFTDASGNPVDFDQVEVWTSGGSTSTLQAAPVTPSAPATTPTTYGTIDVYTPKVASSSRVTVAAPPAAPQVVTQVAVTPKAATPAKSPMPRMANTALLRAMNAANAAAIARMSQQG